jgi:hypothetical protein
MTEASVDGMGPVISELKSDSRMVVLLGSSEGLKGTSRKLSSLRGVTKIRRGLFIVKGYSDYHDALLDPHSFVSFVKTREIHKISEKESNSYSGRAYALVSFSYTNPSAQQKKYVERLIRKTTGVRLRPGLVLFPLLRAKDRRRLIGSKEERVLIDSVEFTRLVRLNGGNVLRWSRLRITNLYGADHIRDAVQQTLSKDLVGLEKRIKMLRRWVKEPEVSIRQSKKNYTILARSFRELKTKWMLSKKLWLYDSEKTLKRIYNILVNTRRVISSIETKCMILEQNQSSTVSQE